MTDITRRNFVSSSSKLAMGAMIVPRKVLGGVGYQAPSDTLNIAIVGAGGMGNGNARELGSENIIAVCDVDMDFVARRAAEEAEPDGEGMPREKGIRWREQFNAARKFSDFRVMLDEMPDIEAVLIATPDHAHAAIAAAAMRAGKHVYCQKPLTYTVHEARVLQELAESTGVVTQMGNQGHSGDDARLLNEWIQAGVIGNVHEVHVWTNRPIWSQGLLRPAPFPEDFDPNSTDRSWWPGSIQAAHATGLHGDFAVPAGLDWDLYRASTHNRWTITRLHPSIGAVGRTSGRALGDMAHTSSTTRVGAGLGCDCDRGDVDAMGWPGKTTRSHTRWRPRCTTSFRVGSAPEVDLHWYDGGLMPKRPEHLPDDVRLNREGGVIFVGERGILMHNTYGRNPRLYPEALNEEAAAVPQSYLRIEDSHEMNWANACKGIGEATCPFSYAAPLTETMLLGIVALRTGQGFKIRYDAENMRVTNSEKANEYLVRQYREGWAI